MDWYCWAVWLAGLDEALRVEPPWEIESVAVAELDLGIGAAVTVAAAEPNCCWSH